MLRTLLRLPGIIARSGARLPDRVRQAGEFPAELLSECRVPAILAAALLTVVPTARADSSWVTVDDLVAAILGTGSYSPTQLAELDLTGDGTVSVTDIACFVNRCHREVQFEAVRTDVWEGEGTVQIRLVAALPSACTLYYEIAAQSATPGTDYVPLSGSVDLNGTSASIPFTVLDDAEPSEPMELVLLRILPGTCYGVGRVNETSVLISDNDATWYGTLVARDPDALWLGNVTDGGSQLGFMLDIVHTPSGYSGTMTSDGAGTLLEGSWPAAISFTDSAFSVSVGPIEMPEESTSFATTLDRFFVLNAADGAPPDDRNVEGDRVLGTYTETIFSAAEPHLAATVSGQFALTRQVQVPSAWRPVLEPSP